MRARSVGDRPSTDPGGDAPAMCTRPFAGRDAGPYGSAFDGDALVDDAVGRDVAGRDGRSVGRRTALRTPGIQSCKADRADKRKHDSDQAEFHDAPAISTASGHSNAHKANDPSGGKL